MGKTSDDHWVSDWVSYPYAQVDLSRCGFKVHIPLRNNSMELSSMINWDSESMQFFVRFLWDKYISQDDVMRHIFSHVFFGRTTRCLPPIIFLFSLQGVNWYDVHSCVSSLKNYLEHTAKQTVSHVHECNSTAMIPDEVLTYLTSVSKKNHNFKKPRITFNLSDGSTSQFKNLTITERVYVRMCKASTRIQKTYTRHRNYRQAVCTIQLFWYCFCLSRTLRTPLRELMFSIKRCGLPEHLESIAKMRHFELFISFSWRRRFSRIDTIRFARGGTVRHTQNFNPYTFMLYTAICK